MDLHAVYQRTIGNKPMLQPIISIAEHVHMQYLFIAHER